MQDLGPNGGREVSADTFDLIETTWLLLVVDFTLLTDPLQIQPWPKDRQNQTKPKREFGEKKSRKSRQKKTDKKVASKGHRRQEGKQ